MARILQKSLFSWKEIEDLGDLKRLELIINYLHDEKFIQTLEKNRGKGRNDYPVRAIWNSLLASIIFQHPSTESLRRELQRNAQLRELCGFDPIKGVNAVPSASAYSHFIRLLMDHQRELDEIFNHLVRLLQKELPNFGKTLAGDSKAISSFAKTYSRNDKKDGRRDLDADFGIKVYKGKNKDGSFWEKKVKWFGYKVHLLVDAEYELPCAYEVTKASRPDNVQMDKLLDQYDQNHPDLLSICEYILLDKGYDDQKLIKKLCGYEISPIIDIRNQWKDGEKTRLLDGRDNIAYDYRGGIYCYSPKTAEEKPMIYAGYEKTRQTNKYLCPAKEYGMKCAGKKHCKYQSGIRIGTKINPRLFTPLPRTSYKWERLYKKRTSVERVNSRLDVSFGFEHHTTRGKAKMKLRCALALTVMLGMALGRIQEKQERLMRSLVKSA